MIHSTRLESLMDSSDPKLDTLREVMAATPSQKVAVFTAFQDTAAYLKARIESRADLLGGRSWTACHRLGDECGRPHRGA